MSRDVDIAIPVDAGRITGTLVVANEAEALKWAKQAPTMMHGGGVELRPLMVR